MCLPRPSSLSLCLCRSHAITRLPKRLSVVYMCAHERNLILMFLHIYRNCEIALINCLIVLVIFVVLSCLFVFVA